MKKIFSILLTLVMAVTMCTACTAAEVTETQDFLLTMQVDNPNMTVNGTQHSIDDEGTTPVIINERTLVPIRAIIEAMGGTVDWEQSTQTATLNYGDDEIQLVIDSETAYLNGAANTLDSAPVIINDRTMLPIRFIAESFKFDVAWDGSAQTVTITKNAANAGTTNEPAAADTPAANAGKTLVVYYSATNTTERVAQMIAEYTGADIFEIEPAEPYTDDDLDWTNDESRVVTEHDNPDTRHVELVSTTVPDFDTYDTIFIGYPIWWQKAAWVVDDFVKLNDFTGKTVIPFCTSMSSGLGESGTALAEMAGTGNWLEGKRFGSASQSQVEEWLGGLNY